MGKVFLGILILVVISFNACSPAKKAATSTVGGVYSVAGSQQVSSILNKNCALCHSGAANAGGIDYINDLNRVAASLVVPGQPFSSKLYTSINSGQMPKSGKLPAAEIKVVEDWIIALGAAPIPSPAPGPSPTPTPSPTPGLPNDTGVTPGKFTEVIAITNAKCVACHSNNHQIPLTNYLQILATVTPGNAASSLLYDSVASGRMPKSGTPLTTDQLTTVRTWIKAGAQNN
ncbi:MAG: hypothetical protein V4736_14605 [Bdellovibrionota bacterium]